MRQLSKLRATATDLAFETKIRCKGGKKRWGVIVAERSKLLYDRRSLFYDHHGRRLHNYTKLGKGGAKISPSTETAQAVARNQKSPEGSTRREQRPATTDKTVVCDIPFNRKDSKGIQQFKSYGAWREMRREPVVGASETRSDRLRSLRRKAFALAERLAREHWDNCKVVFSRRAAFCYAMQALHDGHDESVIWSRYSQSLFICHGLATDMGCRVGKPVFFNLSSTVAKSRQMLEADGLTPATRVARWYEYRRRSRLAKSMLHRNQNVTMPFPKDACELRRMIAESLGCSDLEATEDQSTSELTKLRSE